MVMPLACSLGANQALQPELLLPLLAYSCTSTATNGAARGMLSYGRCA